MKFKQETIKKGLEAGYVLVRQINRKANTYSMEHIKMKSNDLIYVDLDKKGNLMGVEIIHSEGKK